jgi:hypothetical protein
MFFDEWLKSTRKFDYGIGRVEQKRNLNGYKVMVTIQRRASGVVPVDVLLKTRDGQVFTKRCPGENKSETVSFETQAKAKSVTLDPTRDLLEINHWNNRKPFAIKPVFLASFPDFYHRQLFYGPLIWINERDGVRLGIWARYGFPLFNHPTIQAGFSYGLSSGHLNHAVSLNQDLPFFNRRSQIGLLLKDVSGYRQHNLTLKLKWGPYLSRPPFHTLKVEMALNHVYDLSYVNDWDWSTGRNAMITVDYSYNLKTVRWKNRYTVSLQKGLKTKYSDFNYDRISVEVDQTYRWTKKFDVHLRFFGGAGHGTLPIQRRFFLAGDVDPDRLNFWALERKGDLAPLEHYNIAGQGNVRGYLAPFLGEGQPSPSGKWIAAMNLDVPVPGTFVRLFYDLGNVWEDWAGVSSSLRSDAGLTFGFGPLKLDFPLWVSQPYNGKYFQFRWLFRVSLAGGLL